MNSVLLSRAATLEDLTFEPRGSRDGQGMLAFGDAVGFRAKVQEQVEVILDSEGQETRATLTLWVPGTADPVPAEDDRVTRDGNTYIVVETKKVRHLRTGVLNHTRLRCRDE